MSTPPEPRGVVVFLPNAVPTNETPFKTIVVNNADRWEWNTLNGPNRVTLLGLDNEKVIEFPVNTIVGVAYPGAI